MYIGMMLGDQQQGLAALQSRAFEQGCQAVTRLPV
jgi:hypothetical protein